MLTDYVLEVVKLGALHSTELADVCHERQDQEHWQSYDSRTSGSKTGHTW